MSDEIKLKPQEADSAINQLNSVVVDMERIHKEVIANNSEFKSQWEGESSAAFEKYTETIAVNLMGRINGLKQLIDKINHAKETFVEVDNNILK